MVRPAVYGVAVFFVLGLLVLSCRDQLKDEFYPDGILKHKEPLWKTDVSVNSLLAHGVYTPTTLFGGAVLMSAATDFEYVKGSGVCRPGLVMLDVETGRIRWKWEDYMYDRERLFLAGRYIFSDRMVFHIGSRTYCVNLSTGKTEWRKWKADSLNPIGPRAISGIDDRYFFTARVMREDCVSYQPAKLYEDNVFQPAPEKEVMNPQLQHEYFGNTPIPRGAVFFQPTVLDGDTVIAVSYQAPVADGEYNMITCAFGLYNLDKKEWMYKDQVLLKPQRSGVVDWCPVIYDGKIYWNANRDIVCNDLRTGREIWRKAFRQDFLFTSLIIEENKVIANNEDTWLYALDVNKGAELWKTPSAGTSSQLIYLDGYVYYTGGGDGLLHAVDVSDGKTMWKLSSPDLTTDAGTHFLREIAGVPAKNGKKGRVMVTTGRHVYCYEAIR